MVATTPREFPTAGAYQEALQHPGICFTDAELRTSVPEFTKLRQPRAISGAFASVFPVTHQASGTRYAIKCFTRYIPDQQERYSAISDQLATLPAANLSQPWRIGFEYLPDAILVGGNRYPILKMEWAQGLTLSAWLDLHHHERLGVDRLAESFAGLMSDLEAHSIAHGDLQHGNLLVAGDCTLRLLDYDGMYVPALGGLGGTERGHRNYQSPHRGNNDFGTDLDRFSAWVIYGALKAIAIDPGLWRQLHEPQGEYLLLAADDFTNPDFSQRFPALLTHVNREVRELAEQLRSLAAQPLDALPALATTMVGAVAAPIVSSATTAQGLPGWMTEHVSAALSPAHRPLSTIAPLPRFTGRKARDVIAVTVLMLLIAVALPALLILTPPLAAIPPLVAVFLAPAARNARPETAELRRHLEELRQRRAGVPDVAMAVAVVHREQAQFDHFENQRLQQLPAQRKYWEDRYKANLAAIEQEKQRTLIDIDRKRYDLRITLHSRLDQALAAEMTAFVRQQLTRFSISAAGIAGIGPRLTDELAAQGIRTAADFTGISLSTPGGAYNSVTAYLKTVLGPVYVKGIGEVKATALDTWRATHAARIEARFTRTEPSNADAIRSEHEREMSRLILRRQTTENEVGPKRDRAKQQYEAQSAQLASEAANATVFAANKRQEFAHRLLDLQRASAEITALDQRIAAATNHRRDLSQLSYIRFALTGR
ncbi:hypothetical protein [Nocardia sp. alder85J]|uniref:hypothetical protein n=1 Tax=Nocardia sp. alder85J TaxID=2862949 RepID=UPI001CD33CF5|nr:hypothetical protein [Nocardia sp. alder85J]MCX4094140.1 hypothetical protein [Nocardia sp. alder85J]